MTITIPRRRVPAIKSALHFLLAHDYGPNPENWPPTDENMIILKLLDDPGGDSDDATLEDRVRDVLEQDMTSLVASMPISALTIQTLAQYLLFKQGQRAEARDAAREERSGKDLATMMEFFANNNVVVSKAPADKSKKTVGKKKR